MRSDDGFALRIVGQNWVSAHGNGWIDTDRSVLTFPNPTGNSDTRGVIDLGLGDYLVEFVVFQAGGGQYQELFAAKGERPNEADTDTWRLVGYSGIGDYGMPGVTTPGWTLWYSTPGVHGTIGNTSEAWNAVSPYVLSGSNETTRADINFRDPESGAEHELPNSEPFPFDTPADDDNAAMYMTATLRIPSNDTYHLGFRGDDGSWLQVEGQTWDSIVYNQTGSSYIENDRIALNLGTGDSWTIGAITLSPGDYAVNALWWEGAGGASLDLFCGNGRIGPPYAALAEGGAGVRSDHDGLPLVEEEYDWGDAPRPYPTLAVETGGYHVIGGPFMGALVDPELDGNPTLQADGDDLAGAVDDEDGITFPVPLVRGSTVTVLVDTVNSPSTARINAWIDFNGDGIWSVGPAQPEHILFDAVATAGMTNPMTFTVPWSARMGRTYARFRCDTAGGLSPTGSAFDGEVEDYVADALTYIHDEGILHRDLKPGNILIGRGGCVRLADFGLAIPAAEASRLTRSSSTGGTLDYAAPEQRHGLPVDARADVYSFAVMAYELLTGILPLGVFEPPSVHDASLPSAVDAVFAQALRRDPDEPIDVMLLDVVMPRMDARGALPLLRAARPDTPVILCSGYGSTDLVQSLLAGGAQSFLSKPFTRDALVSAIRNALDRPPG